MNQRNFFFSAALLLASAILISPTLQAQGAGDGLFFVAPTTQTKSSAEKDSLEIDNETTLDNIRKEMGEDEKKELQQRKLELYDKIAENVKIERYRQAMDDMKTYLDTIKQLVGPKDYGYKEVMSEAQFLYAQIEYGLESYLQAALRFQRIFLAYKDTPIASKAALEWARISYKLYTRELKAAGKLTAPDFELLVRRLLFVKTIKPDSEVVADAYLLVAEVYTREKDKVKAKEFLEKITNEFPQSSAAGEVEDRLRAL
ncbi:MAG: hypothetical protein JNM63_05510 [Spirochaetia bacterium]|nr:hypothetical protein [Spirochaetia bacterium]